MHKNTGSTSETFARSDQDGIDVKSDSNGEVLIRCSGEEIYGRFWRQGGIHWRVADIKERGTYHRSRFDVGTEITPQLENGGIEFKFMSG